MDDPKCHAVTWTADGRAFVVHDRAAFERNHLIGLLADFPHKCTFASFVRELNRVRVRSAANREGGDAFDAFAVDGFERGNRGALGVCGAKPTTGGSGGTTTGSRRCRGYGGSRSFEN